MSAATKRTRLRAAYLTDTERDLLIHGMLVVRNSLHPSGMATDRAVDFAKTFTCRRIDEMVAPLRAVDAKSKEAPTGEQS